MQNISAVNFSEALKSVTEHWVSGAKHSFAP